MKDVLACDIECYHGYFFIGFRRVSDGKTVGFEKSDRSELDIPRIRQLMMRATIVTFNGMGYDVPMIFYALSGASNAQLKKASDGIIKGGVRWWKVEEYLGVRIPRGCDHIDLIEPQPNAFASLKILKGRLHDDRMQDLPYEPDHRPTHAEMDKLNDYCLNSDLPGTVKLYKALRDPLELREKLGAEYGEDFRSKSDPQIGEAIVKKRIQALTGVRPTKVKTDPGDSFRYRPPEWMKFQRPELQALLTRIREHDFIVGQNLKVSLPKWLGEHKVEIGGSVYAMGIGGLHSTESNRALVSTLSDVLVDADVASQYPAIIMMLGLAPKSLGKSFLDVYGKIKADRLSAKKRAKAIKILLKALTGEGERESLERELAQCVTTDKGMKISLNGVYGKLGSPFSVLFAPHLMIAVTLTGQLSLLMLIERAEAVGISVVSANTDGVVFNCPREKFAGIDGDRLNESLLAQITSQWERETGLNLEFAEYSGIYSQSVNSYIAIKPDGGHKRKGPLGNPWSADPADYDPRASLMKNPQMTICSDAALAKIKYGTPVADTIRACKDIRQFVTVVKVTAGATWRDEYLGKVVRYYWSTRGDPIYEAKAHAKTGNHKKVSKTDGCSPCMDLPDSVPSDIDYDRYIAETESILTEVGFYGTPLPPLKRIRLTKANWANVLAEWAAVA